VLRTTRTGRVLLIVRDIGFSLIVSSDNVAVAQNCYW